MRTIDSIVVHCSASPDDQDVGFLEINRWHLERGWKSPSGIGCGYHFLIRRNGIIEVGRMVNEIGAHVEGANSDSVGICLIGTREFTQEQIESLKRAVSGLLEIFPGAGIFEHREFESAKRKGKTCPNLNVKEVLNIL